MKIHHFDGIYLGNMGIFMGYVSFRVGMSPEKGEVGRVWLRDVA